MIGASRNPTRLDVGATGLLDGERATVVGRAVLESSDRYRWHEYYTRLGGGKMIILVFEAGGWKRFAEFTPERPFTTRDAEAQRVGSTVELHGRPAEIKYVSTSRVVYSEGKTWDGVRAGSEARYFNAEAEGEMIVVSWTGEEIEFYHGRKLPSFTIPHAFKLPDPPVWQRVFSNGFDAWSGNAFAFALIALTALWLVAVLSSSDTPAERINPPPVAAAPAIQLPDNQSGTLAGERFVIRGRARVEVDEMGSRFRRYEYDLADERGGHALLIEKLDDNLHDWVLLHAVAAPAWLTPIAAAAVREGMSVRLSGRPAKVLRLQASHPDSGAAAPGAPSTAGAVRYGFLARSDDTWILVRWNEQTLDVQQGRAVPESTILRAFGVSSAR